MIDDLATLLNRAKALPPPTPREQEENAFDFAYGNLALSTNHRPQRAAFLTMARSRCWTLDQFNKWAHEKEWW